MNVCAAGKQERVWLPSLLAWLVALWVQTLYELIRQGKHIIKIFKTTRKNVAKMQKTEKSCASIIISVGVDFFKLNYVC